MSYNTRFVGGIGFTPPLPWSLIRESRFREDVDTGHVCIQLVETEEERDVDEGRLTRITASVVEAVTEESFRAYTIEEELQELAEAVNRLGYEVKVDGYLEAFGEDLDDRYRLYLVRDPQGLRVVKVVPSMRWPLSQYGLGEDVIVRMER